MLFDNLLLNAYLGLSQQYHVNLVPVVNKIVVMRSVNQIQGLQQVRELLLPLPQVHH